MGKYTPPAVTFQDVLAALPALPMPLALIVVMRPTKGSVSHMYSSVELVHYDIWGAMRVYKRWGRDVRAGSEKDVMRALLLAAQEAYVYLEAKDPAELARFIEWQLDLPRSLG